MKIKIEEKNAAKIESALLAANGKATQHTFTTYAEIEDEAQRFERSLSDALLPKSFWKGAKYRAGSGGSVPNAYKYSRITTDIVLDMTSTGCFLISVYGGSTWDKTDHSELVLTPAQAEKAQAEFRKRFKVQA